MGSSIIGVVVRTRRRLRFVVLPAVAVVLAGLVVTPAAQAVPVAATAPVELATGAPILQLPFLTQSHLTQDTGKGQVGNATASAKVARACNGGASLFNPRWFTLPTSFTGPVYAHVRGWSEEFYPTDRRVGFAIADSATATVLSCSADGLLALPRTRELSLVMYWPYDPQSDCTPSLGYCQDDQSTMELFVGRTTGVPPANDHYGAATAITKLPYVATVDNSLADADGGDVGVTECDESPLITHTVWWTYTPTTTGPPPSISIVVAPELTPYVYPQHFFALPSANGPVDIPGTEADPCGVQDPTELQAGTTYLIGVHSLEETYRYNTPLLLGGTFSLEVTAPGHEFRGPSTPLGVGATNNDAAHTATVTWNPPATAGDAPITGYLVSRDGTDTGQTGPWRTVLPATARSETFKYLTNWGTYHLSVQAVTSHGLGPAASATVSMVATTPSAPIVDLVSDYSLTDGPAFVTWDPPAATGGAAITGYRVRTYASGTSRPIATQTVPAAATSFTLALPVGATRSIDVTAITARGLGETSAISTPATNVGKGFAPGAVTVTVGPSQVMAASITATWRAPVPAVSAWKLTCSGPVADGSYQDVGYATGSNPSSATCSHLLPWTDYYLQLVEYTAQGFVGVLPAVQESTTGLAPSAVNDTNVTVGAAGSRKATLTWSAPTHSGAQPVSGYRLRTYDNTGAAPVLVATVNLPAAARSYLATLPKQGVNYYFDIAAVSSVGTGLVTPVLGFLSP